jgi:hypothetical protein
MAAAIIIGCLIGALWPNTYDGEGNMTATGASVLKPLGTVFINSSVPQGKFYATAKENIVTYYINMSNGDIARAFDLTTDETGYIGIKEYPDEDTARVLDLVMSGVTFFPERADGIVIGTIAGA